MITSVMFWQLQPVILWHKIAMIEVTITWKLNIAATVPGCICFLLVPIFLYKSISPEQKKQKEAPAIISNF
jgi:DASS family divalent anion:Na+ symporter